MTFRKPVFRAVVMLTIVTLEREIEIAAADLALHSGFPEPIACFSL